MNPLRLELRRCRSWDHLDLELPEGIAALIGKNGSGKSSAVNAIEVALFGPESRTLADLYPRGGGEEPLVITLTFEHDGETYRVRRSFSPKGRGTSKTDLEIRRPDLAHMVSGEWVPMTLEAQSVTNEQIRDLIGITRDTFRASSFLAQGDAGRFCEAAPRDRKRVLSEVVGLGQWDIWLDRARKEKRVAELALENIAGSLERAEEELTERSLVEQEREDAILERRTADLNLKETLAALTTAREALAEAEKQAERRAVAERAVQDADRQVRELKDRIEGRQSEIAMIDVRLAERENLEGIAGQVERLATDKDSLVKALQAWKERERVERDLAAKSAEYENAKGEAVRLSDQTLKITGSMGTEKCDRCGQTLHEEAALRAAESFAADAKRELARAEKIDDEISGLSATLSEMPNDEPDATRLPMLERSLSDAQSAKARLAALEEAAARKVAAEREADEMRAELLSREQVLVAARADAAEFGPHVLYEMDGLRHALTKHEVAEGTIRFTLSELERAIAGADTQLARLDKIAADVHDAHARRDELLLELDLLVAMEKACGPNGVPALILETVAIPQVEAEATRILGLLGGPAYACELRTLREKKDGGLADTLDVILLTETGEAPYESFSGGERARIAFALRLALAQLLASRKGSSTGLLIIDELSGLDAEGVAALVSVLEDLATKIRTVLVVSHDAELRDSFENTILLEQVDGKSRVVNDLPLEVVS